MAWRQMQLGDVIRLKRGHDLPMSERLPGNVPIVSSSGVTGFHSVAKAPGPGVVTGRYGTLGEVHYIEEDFWPLNTALYVEDFKGNHPRFVAYLLKTLDLGNQNAAGAVPGVNRNALHQMRVTIPELNAQRRVSCVMEAYDDLITTNQRRITLLEDAARRLYREWFVHLRFPGFEAVPVEAGIPRGWQLKALGAVAPLNYGKALKATNRRAGRFPVYGSSGIVGTHDAAFVDAGAIVVGRKGNVGSLFFSHLPCYPIDTVFFVEPERVSFHLFFSLHRLNFISSDAAVPGLSRSYAHSLPLVLPDERVGQKFEEAVAPLFGQSQLLTEQNAKLAEARDLLLPKLVSGKLKASTIRLPEPTTT